MYKQLALGLSGSTDCNHSVSWRILAMFHTPSVRCLLALCFVLRWSTTAAARLSSTATQLEPDEQEINPSFADVDSYHTCELSEGIYTMSNLSEILCASDKRLKEIIEMHPNSSNKLVLAPGVPVRLVGKGGQRSLWERNWQTKFEFEISLLPGASLFLEALHFQGKIEVLQDETSIGQSKMSYLTFVNCSVEPPAPDEKQLALAKLEATGIQDPSASAWRGWLMLRDAALTLQIHDSSLRGGAFVKQSPTFNLSASKSEFRLEGQGFQLVNVTSHIQLEEVVVLNFCRISGHPSFQMLSGRHEVHVTGSTFKGSAIQIMESLHLILDVSTTQFRKGKRAIFVTGCEGNSSQVDLQHVKINLFSESGVRASDFQVFCLPHCRPNGCAHSGCDWRWCDQCERQRLGNLASKEGYRISGGQCSGQCQWSVHFGLFSGCGVCSVCNARCPHSWKWGSFRRQQLSDLKWPCVL